VGAIGISGLVERICDSRYRPHQHLVGYVRDAARAISRELTR
jgi:DNA-binding IclR family transcriptional regulator